MSSRSSASTGLIRRGALALLLLGAAILVSTISLAEVARSRLPATALAWLPAHAASRSAQAARILDYSDSPEGRARAGAVAREALRHDPMQVGAIRTLALIADADGSRDRARQLIARSERLSRRDGATQAWLVQYHTRRGEMREAIAHLGTALTTSTRASAQFVPLLAATLADAGAVAPIRSMLARQPPWRLDFVAESISTAPNGVNLARTLAGFLDPRDPVDRVQLERLIDRMAREGAFEWAAAQARALGGPARSGGTALLDGGFEQGDTSPPFGWTFAQEPELYAERVGRPDGHGGSALQVVAANGRTGEAARQLLNLAPGRYRITAETGALPVALGERPQIAIRCARGPARTILSTSVVGAETTAWLDRSFDVPADCRWQWLSIAVAGEGPRRDAPPWLDNLAIVK